MKDSKLSLYYHVVTSMIDHFDAFKIEHVLEAATLESISYQNWPTQKRKVGIDHYCSKPSQHLPLSKTTNAHR